MNRRSVPQLFALCLLGASLTGMPPVQVAAGAPAGQSAPQEVRVPPWLHDLPVDPLSGAPLGLVTLGRDALQDEDSTEGDGRRGEQGLPLEPTRKISFRTEEGSWLSVDVSPDGTTVLFDLLGDLYTVPIGGGQATRITEGLAWDAMPRYSPDGGKVVFVSDRSGEENLWILDLRAQEDADRFRQLTRGDNNFASPDWTPDGQYIIASKGRATFGVQKLWLIHAEKGGDGIRLLEEPRNQKQIGAAVSPDGRWIWTAVRTGDWQYNAIFPQYQLAVYDRRSGELATRSFRLGSAFRPTLSPDGRWLVYGSRQGTQTGLRIRELATGEERWLAYPVQRDDQESRATRDVLPGMDFTPDSREVVVSYGGKIWRVPIDGSAPIEVPFVADVELDAGPALAFDYPVDDRPEFEVHQIRDAVPSPDGSKLAFTALDRLYVMEWPDGQPRRLTDDEFVEAMPAWAPDGASLAYVTWDEQEGGHIRRVSVSGGDSRRLTTMPGIYQQPAFSPDGERIVALRGPARAYHEADSAFAPGATDDLVWIPAGGGDWTLIAPADRRTAPHFTSEPDRIYLYAGRAGLVSIRWDGTDQRTHLKVTRRPVPGAEGPPPPANLVRIAPTGDRALAFTAGDVYLIGAIPEVGPEGVSISLANLKRAPVPVERLTDIGGEFPTWGADGRTIHWSIGNAHVVWEIEQARRVREQIEAFRKRQKKDQEEAADEQGERAAAEAGDRAGGDEPPAAGAGTGEQQPGEQPAEAQEPEPYRPFERRVVVLARRDLPQGVAVLTGARIITMRGDEVIERGDIVVRGHRIEAVGPTGQVALPDGAERIDVSGKTIVPGFVDTHAHLRPNWGVHKQQSWAYMANLAYGVTTTRDPQTGTTDVLTYADKVETGEMLGPRIYSTGPGVFGPFNGVFWRDAEHARDVLKRYSEYYNTHTIKMYMSGNRRIRQWILNAAREQQLMPTTEGGLDMEMNLTLAIDGYPGLEHSLPIHPLYRDVVQLFAQAGITYTPTLIVSYGGPFGESYFYTRENPYEDPKLRRFTPYDELARRTRRRGQGVDPGPGGWFRDEEFAFSGHAEVLTRILRAGGHAGVGSHGQLQGLGYHWELWMVGSGGMSPHEALRVATIEGARAIGMDADLGSIEPGKLADLVVLDADPLADLRNSVRIYRVMKNGRLYDDDTLDEVYPRRRPARGLYWLQEYRVQAAAGLR